MEVIGSFATMSMTVRSGHSCELFPMIMLTVRKGYIFTLLSVVMVILISMPNHGPHYTVIVSCVLMALSVSLNLS